MHIPDGFISPKVYIPAYAISFGLWAYSMRRFRKVLNTEMIPFLGATTSFAFILMMIVVPLPGGTTAHAIGIGPLTILFGPSVSFVCISLVLLIQALIFGNGGITTLSVNALAIGFVGSFSIYLLMKLSGRHEKIGILFSTFFSILLSAFILAVLLGIQPLIATNEDGRPLFYPFGVGITIPAMLLPHIFVGIAEGILTIIAVTIVRRFNWEKRIDRKD